MANPPRHGQQRPDHSEAAGRRGAADAPEQAEHDTGEQPGAEEAEQPATGASAHPATPAPARPGTRQPAPAPRHVQAIVAPGRTVMTGEWDAAHAAGPGETVSLEESEAAYLTAMGFLVVTGGGQMVHATGSGPPVNRDESPRRVEMENENRSVRFERN